VDIETRRPHGKKISYSPVLMTFRLFPTTKAIDKGCPLWYEFRVIEGTKAEA